LHTPNRLSLKMALSGPITTGARKQAGVVSADDAQRWWTHLREAHDAGTFFYAFTALVVAAQRGEDDPANLTSQRFGPLQQGIEHHRWNAQVRIIFIELAQFA